MPSLLFTSAWKPTSWLEWAQHHRGLADREQAGVELAHVERGDLGRRDRAALAQVVPESEPLADVAHVETELAVVGVERLAALAQPDFQRRLVASAVEQAVEAGTLGSLGDLEGELADLRPGHVMGRSLQPERADEALVEHHRGRVQAEADPKDLAIDLAAVDRRRAEVGKVEALADERIEREQGAAARIFVDVAIVHLDHVGRVAARRLGRKPRPIVGPAERLAGDRHARGSCPDRAGWSCRCARRARASPTRTCAAGSRTERSLARPVRRTPRPWRRP